jgi:hypothetical protein
MSLKGIIAISGMPGLYKVLAQTKSGFIVESLNDKKRMPVASTQRISMLEDISVYTQTDDLPLKDVMMKFLEFSGTNSLIDPKSDPAALKTFFKSIVPDFDTERVYPSDIKKMIGWFTMVKDFVAVEDEPENATAAAETVVTAAEEKVVDAKPKRAKKAPAENTDTEAETPAPKKKAAPKSKKKED